MFSMKDFEKAMVEILDARGIKFTTTNSTHFGTLPSITRHYLCTGELMVWNGASDQTIFSTEYLNCAFRAWHDFHHVDMQHPFTKLGEAAVCEAQMRDVREYVDNEELQRYMCMLLDAEINGQVGVFLDTGTFVEDQRTFAVQYINDKYSVQVKL